MLNEDDALLELCKQGGVFEHFMSQESNPLICPTEFVIKISKDLIDSGNKFNSRGLQHLIESVDGSENEEQSLSLVYSSIIDILKQILSENKTDKLPLDVAFIRILYIIDYTNYDKTSSIYNVLKDSTFNNLVFMIYFIVYPLFGKQARKLKFNFTSNHDIQLVHYFTNEFLPKFENKHITFKYCNNTSTAIQCGLEQYVENNISSNIDIQMIFDIISDFTCFKSAEYMATTNWIFDNLMKKNSDFIEYQNFRLIASPVHSLLVSTTFHQSISTLTPNDTSFLESKNGTQAIVYFGHELQLSLMSTLDNIAIFFAKQTSEPFWYRARIGFDLFLHKFRDLNDRELLNKFHELLKHEMYPLSLFFNGNNELDKPDLFPEYVDHYHVLLGYAEQAEDTYDVIMHDTEILFTFDYGYSRTKDIERTKTEKLIFAMLIFQVINCVKYFMIYHLKYFTTMNRDLNERTSELIDSLLEMINEWTVYELYDVCFTLQHNEKIWQPFLKLLQVYDKDKHKEIYVGFCMCSDEYHRKVINTANYDENVVTLEKDGNYIEMLVDDRNRFHDSGDKQQALPNAS